MIVDTPRMIAISHAINLGSGYRREIGSFWGVEG
jgi:hypothetical protein